MNNETEIDRTSKIKFRQFKDAIKNNTWAFSRENKSSVNVEYPLLKDCISQESDSDLIIKGRRFLSSDLREVMRFADAYDISYSFTGEDNKVKINFWY